MEVISSASASSSNTSRGCFGLGVIDPRGISAKYAPADPAASAGGSPPAAGPAGSGTADGPAGSLVTFATATPRSAVITGVEPGNAAPAAGADTCFS